jgi:hypothetical protein
VVWKSQVEAAVTSTEASQRAAVLALLVENPTAARVDAKGLDLKAARILLFTVTWVPSYCEKLVTPKISSHACLIIEILA